MTRVLALVQKRRGLAPGQRFRLEQWAPRLRTQHGISLDFAPFESPALTSILYQPGRRLKKATLMLRDAIRRREIVARAAQYDAVIIYREVSLLGPAIYERLLSRTGVPIIFDFDDAVWLTGPGSANGVFSGLRFPRKTATICRLASAVAAGNHFLAEYAKQYSKNVDVVPTTVDLDTSPLQPPISSDGAFRIVWVGSSSTLHHLDVVRRPLERFAQTQPTVLRVICSDPPKRPFKGVELEFVPWSAAGEALKLARSHVGIMPLPDTEFSRGKCGLKALQYMAVGRPVVVSPVALNADIVQHGENGLLASTDAQWVQALQALAGSPPLRQRLGLAGRSTVEERFSAKVGAAAFAAVVNGVLERSGRQDPVG
jgi:glycosyltransferase involved in cell wall biosynthesis